MDGIWKINKNKRCSVVWTHTSQLQKKITAISAQPWHFVAQHLLNLQLFPRAKSYSNTGSWTLTWHPWKTSRFLWMYIIPVLSDRHHRISRVYNFFPHSPPMPTVCLKATRQVVRFVAHICSHGWTWWVVLNRRCRSFQKWWKQTPLKARLESVKIKGLPDSLVHSGHCIRNPTKRKYKYFAKRISFEVISHFPWSFILWL